MNKMDSSQLGLLLLRTPFQAWLAEKVVAAESIDSYDVLYVTHDNSAEDRHYFEQITKKSRKSSYCWIPVRRFDIINHLDFQRQTPAWIRTTQYQKVVLASINSLVFNGLTTHHKECQLITFDDGLSNIVPDGMYKIETKCWRLRIYQRLFGAVSLKIMKQRVRHHYSIYPKFNNILEPDRVRYLEGWCRRKPSGSTTGSAVTYFVGQPLHEVMSAVEIEKFRQRLTAMQIEHYVRHPREREVLDIGAVEINKFGRIAEDAILLHAKGKPIQLIGWFSSVLFNLAGAVDRCTTLLFAAAPETPLRAAMAREAGCFVEYV